ncbi:MAG: hypothetical protein ACI4O3_00295 [Oscillospiraceae bacterium]
MKYLASVFTNQYLLLLITAAIGAAIGKINIKGFSLGGAGGIFSGIFVGWLMTTVALKVPAFSSLVNETTGDVTLVSDSFMTFFLLLFICSIGLGVGGKIKTVLNRHGLKLIVIGVLIPVVSMALTWGCLKAAPALMGDNYNGYQVSGMYSGAMTNTAAYGNSMAVISGMDDIDERYAELSDEEKSAVLEMIGAEDTTPTDNLNEGQVAAFKGKAKANISLGYAISFPVGTLVIIIAMSVFAALTKKQRSNEDHSETAPKTAAAGAVKEKPLFFDAVVYGIVFLFGIALGSIKIPLGNSITFTLSPVGGVLISALVFSNIPKIGPIDMTSSPKVLGFMREFSLIFFMSVVGMQYGYDVIHAFSGSGLVIALMAAVVEIVAILVAVLVGRLMKIRWDRLSGAICGGCTSATGLGAAISTMGREEPTLGYGVSQPFAILANVLLISLFHSKFFI